MNEQVRPPVPSQLPQASRRPPGDSSAVEQPAGRRVDPVGGLGEIRSVPWSRVEAGRDSRSIVVFWSGGAPACFGLAGVTAERDGETMVVTVREGRYEEARDRPCPDIATFKHTVVRTASPVRLDDVIDGSLY